MSCNTKQTNSINNSCDNRKNITEKLSQLTKTIDAELENVCANYLIGPKQLTDAMKYSLLAGGKRIRPAIVLLTNELCKGKTQQAMIPAIAIEMIHTFSLIHDDLPAMDNDDYRRGRLTNHKVFGEAIAILAGDALLTYAFELIAKHSHTDSETRIAMIYELAHATGSAGMTGGQVLDILFAESKSISDNKKDTENNKNNITQEIEHAENIHLLKTAALIRCACRLGAISASANHQQIQALSDYGEKLGLAFQIVDDLLDQTQTQETLGKGAGKDHKTGKPNYAVITSSIEHARQRADSLIKQAKQALKIFNEDAILLHQLADLILNRTS